MQLRQTIYTALAATTIWASVWADGSITAVEHENSDLKLEIWTVQGNKYQLQCSTNLVAGSWEDLGEQITATRSSTNLTVGTEAASCWFRVVEEKVEVAEPRTPYVPPAAVPQFTPVRK